MISVNQFSREHRPRWPNARYIHIPFPAMSTNLAIDACLKSIEEQIMGHWVVGLGSHGSKSGWSHGFYSQYVDP